MGQMRSRRPQRPRRRSRPTRSILRDLAPLSGWLDVPSRQPRSVPSCRTSVRKTTSSRSEVTWATRPDVTCSTRPTRSRGSRARASRCRTNARSGGRSSTPRSPRPPHHPDSNVFRFCVTGRRYDALPRRTREWASECGWNAVKKWFHPLRHRRRAGDRLIVKCEIAPGPRSRRLPGESVEPPPRRGMRGAVGRRA